MTKLDSLEQYKEFNAERFIKSLKGLEKKKIKLQGKLEELSELPPIGNNSGVRSSNVSNPTATLAERRLKIIEEIEMIDAYQDVYQRAKGKLSEEDRELIEGFFEGKEPKWKFVQNYCKKKYIGEALVYRKRKAALKHFTDVMEKNYLV